MNDVIFPGDAWADCPPAEVGMDAEQLAAAESAYRAQAGDAPYRVVIVRRGAVVAEWLHGLGRDERLGMASAVKSIYGSVLGIAIAEGRLPSADAQLLIYYPQALSIREGEGPKPGRYAFPKDRDITFRQLIANTSGYMKPDELPGQVFHYQTFGMSVLAKALARVYGLYDPNSPQTSPGFRALIDDKIRQPIGASWEYTVSNFEHPPGARLEIFGNFEGVRASPHDLARLGWLWANWGRWAQRQVIPEAWLREATQTAPDIRAHCPPEQWRYGYGFWTNADGGLWPAVPRDSFMAAGAGKQYVWAWPAQALVVVQSPGLWDQGENSAAMGAFLQQVAAACRPLDSL